MNINIVHYFLFLELIYMLSADLEFLALEGGHATVPPLASTAAVFSAAVVVTKPGWGITRKSASVSLCGVARYSVRFADLNGIIMFVTSTSCYFTEESHNATFEMFETYVWNVTIFFFLFTRSKCLQESIKKIFIIF